MTLRDLVLKNRSYRRFHQDAIDLETLKELVDLARLSASGANRQPLKYILSCDAETNNKIFPCTRWAGYRFLMCGGWSPTIARLFAA